MNCIRVRDQVGCDSLSGSGWYPQLEYNLHLDYPSRCRRAFHLHVTRICPSALLFTLEMLFGGLVHQLAAMSRKLYLGLRGCLRVCR
jgi:hypothetical protein